MRASSGLRRRREESRLKAEAEATGEKSATVAAEVAVTAEAIAEAEAEATAEAEAIAEAEVEDIDTTDTDTTICVFFETNKRLLGGKGRKEFGGLLCATFPAFDIQTPVKQGKRPRIVQALVKLNISLLIIFCTE